MRYGSCFLRLNILDWSNVKLKVIRVNLYLFVIWCVWCSDYELSLDDKSSFLNFLVYTHCLPYINYILFCHTSMHLCINLILPCHIFCQLHTFVQRHRNIEFSIFKPTCWVVNENIIWIYQNWIDKYVYIST